MKKKQYHTSRKAFDPETSYIILTFDEFKLIMDYLEVHSEGDGKSATASVRKALALQSYDYEDGSRAAVAATLSNVASQIKGRGTYRGSFTDNEKELLALLSRDDFSTVTGADIYRLRLTRLLTPPEDDEGCGEVAPDA